MKEADSNLSESEDEDEASKFQMAEINYGKSDSQFSQLDEELKPRISSIFNQTASRNIGIKTKLDLGEVIFLESQSTMNIFFNRALAENITKSKTKIQLKSNGRTMPVYHKARVNGYQISVWFSENAITNIVALRNLRLQYLVTYRSNKMVFIVHIEYGEKPDMKFRMHDSGLY